MCIRDSHITDELYAKLRAAAESQGQSPDTFAAEVLAHVVDDQKNVPDDPTPTPRHLPPDHPFYKLAGIFTSGLGDLGRRHDEYLAEEYADDHNDEP